MRYSIRKGCGSDFWEKEEVWRSYMLFTFIGKWPWEFSGNRHILLPPIHPAQFSICIFRAWYSNFLEKCDETIHGALPLRFLVLKVEDSVARIQFSSFYEDLSIVYPIFTPLLPSSVFSLSCGKAFSLPIFSLSLHECTTKAVVMMGNPSSLRAGQSPRVICWCVGLI